MKFSYGEKYLRSIFSNIGGVSFGNQSDNVIVWMDEIPSQNASIKITPYPVPENLNINGDGVLYGTPGIVNAYPFRVRLTDANGMSHIVKFDLTTELKEHNWIESECNIYPNPSSGIINIELMDLNVTELHYNILSITGEKMYFGKLSDLEECKLDVSQLSGGIYFLEIFSGERHYRKRFVKI
jgi:hypothetical protein